MAYVREKKMTVGAKTYGGYYQLVEGYRVEGKVRQRVIAHLGKFPTIEDARLYADKHFSHTPIDVLRQLCQDALDTQTQGHRLGSTEDERVMASKKLEEIEAKMLVVFDSLSEEDQKAVRSEYPSALARPLNKRYNHRMIITIVQAFGPVVEKYKELGKSGELTAEAVRAWRSLPYEQQMYTLNGYISKEIREFVAPAVRDHVKL